MPTNMVDGYVRRDSNVGSQEDRESGLVLPDGVFMPSSAFRNKVPQTDNSGGGVSGGKVLSWKDLSPEDRRKNFADIMRRKK